MPSDFFTPSSTPGLTMSLNTGTVSVSAWVGDRIGVRVRVRVRVRVGVRVRVRVRVGLGLEGLGWG